MTLHHKGYESLSHKIFDIPLQLKPSWKEKNSTKEKKNQTWSQSSWFIPHAWVIMFVQRGEKEVKYVVT